MTAQLAHLPTALAPEPDSLCGEKQPAWTKQR